MFDKFTERSRKVMELSRKHAQRLNSEFIGTEHILLAILQEGGGVAAKALKILGVDQTAMTKEIEKVVGPLPPAPDLKGSMPFSPRAKQVLELTTEEACRSGLDTIGTEHLLLGLFRERDGVGFQVLVTFGIEEKALRAAVDEALGRNQEKKTVPIVVPAAGLVTMKVWIFKGIEPGTTGTPKQGRLYYNNDKIDIEKVSAVLVEGIPAETQESIAAAIAINCGAVAFMIEVLKPE